jgi:prolyl 4-hydroxylase
MSVIATPRHEDAVETADRLLAAGHVAAAIAHIEHAGAMGDPAALFLAAGWHLMGRPVPRDLPRARQLLRRAVEIGHDDAALTEIALVANGSGGPADWPAAVALLRRAARVDPLAAEQLAVLDAMALDAGGRPLTTPPAELLSTAPRITRFRGCLAERECAALAGTATALMRPATVVDPATGETMRHPIRTCDVATIGPARESLVVRALNARLASVSGTNIACGEPLAVLRYASGQEYRAHLDTIAGLENQRCRTVLVYLNHGYRGGETVFPRLGLEIVPRAGDVIVFDTLLPDGRADPLAIHAGRPIVGGTKWIASRWIRTAPIDPWHGQA